MEFGVSLLFAGRGRTSVVGTCGRGMSEVRIVCVTRAASPSASRSILRLFRRIVSSVYGCPESTS